MPNDPVDLLQVKIEKARESLSTETRQAIDAVPWKMVILEMRQSKGYNFEQLGDLETETELLLCGLLSPEDYPKELEKRMRIPRAQVDVLVNEMNERVFKKIREELIKNTERRKVSLGSSGAPDRKNALPKERWEKDFGIKKEENEVLKQAGIEVSKIPELLPEKKIEQREDMLKKIENPNLIKKESEMHPILMQKFSGPFQIQAIKTEHSLPGISHTDAPTEKQEASALKKNLDPYRETPV